MPSNSTLLKTAVYMVLSLFVFLFCQSTANQVGEVQAILDMHKRAGPERLKIKSYSLTHEKNPGDLVSADDLQEVATFQTWVSYDAIKQKQDAVGRRIKAHFSPGHVLADHELIFDEQNRIKSVQSSPPPAQTSD